MAKSKYETHIKPKLFLIECWARDGLTDEQICHNLGISKDTFYKYKKEKLEFSDALKRGKEIIDYEVENALLKKALGFKEQIIKPIKCKKTKYKDGKKIEEKEEIQYAPEEVYIPPDTTAQIFWLKNRKPQQWRDKQIEVTSSGQLEELIKGLKENE